MERQQPGNSEDFRNRFQNLFQVTALSPAELTYVFDERVSVGEDGVPLVDHVAFTDPFAWTKMNEVLEAIEARSAIQASNTKPAERTQSKRNKVKVAAGIFLALDVAIYGSSVVYELSKVEEMSVDSVLSASATGLIGVSDNIALFANKIMPRDNINSRSADQPGEPPQPTASENSTSQPSASVTPAKPKPSPSPTTLPTLPTQPFSLEYSSDAHGNTVGFAAVYPKSANYSHAQIQAAETCNNPTENVVLSFSGNSSYEQLQKTVEVLKSKNAGALFFPSSLTQEQTDSLRQQGFYVGTRASEPEDMTKMTDEQIREAIAAGGVSTLFRPAGAAKNEKGYFDPRIRQIAGEMGKSTCLFTTELQDTPADITPEQMATTVTDKVKTGGVINIDGPNTKAQDALPALIDKLRAKNMPLCPISKTTTSSNFSKTPLCKG